MAVGTLVMARFLLFGPGVGCGGSANAVLVCHRDSVGTAVGFGLLLLGAGLIVAAFVAGTVVRPAADPSDPADPAAPAESAGTEPGTDSGG